MLLIAAVFCIILGLGLPTVGVYVLLAVLIAPSLVEVGVTPLVAREIAATRGDRPSAEPGHS